MGARAPALAGRAAAGLILLLAASVRLSDPPTHFRGGRFTPPDPDAAMHFRRASAWAAELWPPLRDPFLGFPEGAPIHWSPGWSAALGWWGWLWSGGRSEGPVFELAVALFPLLVGVLTVWMAIRVAGRLFGERAGLAAGVIAALTPQYVSATQFARTDHNPAEALFMLALAGAASREEPRRWEVALLSCGVCLFWVGGFAYAAIAAFALMVAALYRPGERPLARAGVPGLLLGALLLLPLALKNGYESGHLFSYAFLSLFQPIFLAVIALGSAWVVGVAHLPRYRKVLIFAGGAALIAAAVTVLPAALQGVQQWLVREDPWLSTVQEMNPILKGPFWAPGSWEVAVRVLGWGYPLVPLLCGVLAGGTGGGPGCWR